MFDISFVIYVEITLSGVEDDFPFMFSAISEEMIEGLEIGKNIFWYYTLSFLCIQKPRFLDTSLHSE
jgi:hypothetical protein